jgi:exopolysaccharide biosynthesis protein
MNNYFDDNPRRRPRGGGNDYFRENRRPVQGSGRGSVRGGGRGRSRGRKAPVPLLIIIDILLAALLLLIFYVTNYEMTGETEGVALPTPAASVAVLTPSAANSPDPTESAAADTPAPTVDPNDWRAKFADKFTDGAVETDENSYKSANIDITIDKIMKDDVPYFIADIYVADVQNFRTAFAKQADVLGAKELTSTIAEENNAILAINGDHCLDNKGLIIRNGNYYPAEMRGADVLVMYRDGTMDTLPPEEVDVEKIKSESPYQVWSFGPMLLKDGQPMTEFNSDITRSNPRSAVGYYEPGHYCFVQVGGRLEDYSLGCTMEELSQLFADLGCKVAYNLDGGQSSEIIFMGEMLNQQNGRRSTPDILYIGE